MSFINKHKLVRRLCLFWAMWLTTVVVLRVTEAAVVGTIPTAVSTIAVAVIGLVGTMITFYTKRRHDEDA